jgi:hypothetical protein
MLGLVALAGVALAHILLNHMFHVRKMEVTAEAVKCTLDPLMALSMYRRQDFLQQRRGRRNEEAVGILDHAIDNPPWRAPGASLQIVVEGDQGRVSALR